MTTRITGAVVVQKVSSLAVPAVDVLTCNSTLWLGADRNAFNSSISLGVYDESTLLFTVQANAPRSDVGTYLGDNGVHGFGVDNPAFVKDGHAHKITVRPGNFGSPLFGPQTLTCQP